MIQSLVGLMLVNQYTLNVRSYTDSKLTKFVYVVKFFSKFEVCESLLTIHFTSVMR